MTKTVAKRVTTALACGRYGCPCQKTGQNGHGNTHCPAHDDQQPSLSVSHKGDKLLFKCHAGCSQTAVTGSLRDRQLLPEPTEKKYGPSSGSTGYLMRDSRGTVVAIHVRKDYRTGKRTWWESPDGTKGLHGKTVTSLPLFGTETLVQLDDGSRVVVTEGEPAAEALQSTGIRSLGTVTGANTIPDRSVLEPLVRFQVVLWPDNDDPGYRHMNRIAASLLSLGCRDFRKVNWQEAPPKGDAANALRNGTNVAQLIEDASPWKYPLEERQELLEEVAAFVRQYVVLTEDQLVVLSLWIVHAHAFKAAETTPYISIRSVEKRSGKTRTLEVIEHLVPDPLRTENISVAALAHSIEAGATLLLDEADTIFGRGRASETQEMLSGVLDSGYRVNGSYGRMAGTGAKMYPRRLRTFSPKVLSGRGKLPGTLDDRSIILEL